MFCDELKLTVIAGKGGNGCVSFRREKYVPKGGPDGGDGGKGGDIIFIVNLNLNTLSHLASQKTYKAYSGESGKGKNMYGKSAENLILEVPLGTIIFTKDKSEILADLSGKGEEVIIAKGGKGGLGNAHFASATRQVPRFAEKGEPGEEKEIILELKLVADVGLIGMPSAGKSTLLSVISNARPKIAAYDFTTLIPNLGVVSMAKFGGSANDSFVAADIPGLIEGASHGKGLGFQFLKHISRTRLLVHLIDAYKENFAKNYKIIREELMKFDKELAKREEIIVLNKIDIADEKIIEKCKKELKKTVKTKKIFLISGVTHEGVQELLFEISKKLKTIKKKEKPEKITSKPVLIPLQGDANHFSIDKMEDKNGQKIFYISGTRFNQLITMSDLKNIESMERIYAYMDRFGIQRKLNNLNASLGDIIVVKKFQFPYRP